MPAYDVSGKNISISVCDLCQFAWQWPIRRTTDESREYFQSAYETKKQQTYFDKNQRREIAKLQLAYLETLEVPKRTLLDIGCGDGILVLEAATSWHATGIDPALPRSEHGQNFDLLKVDSIRNDQTFGCVTLWDVIEHLPDPEIILNTAWGHVASGGWLIIETGNYQSMGRVLSGRQWWAWQCDHRWYFAPPTLEKILTRFGYAEMRLAPDAFRPWVKVGEEQRAPSRLRTAFSILKRPLRAKQVLLEHGKKRYAAKKWPWAGLPIFTIAVRK